MLKRKRCIVSMIILGLCVNTFAIQGVQAKDKHSDNNTAAVEQNEEVKNSKPQYDLSSVITPSEKVVSSYEAQDKVTVSYMDDGTIRIGSTKDRNEDIHIKLNDGDGDCYWCLYEIYDDHYMVAHPNFKADKNEVIIDLPGSGGYVLSRQPIKGARGEHSRMLPDGREEYIDGDVIVKGWFQSYITWIYCDKDGIIQKGWQDINGKRYYFEGNDGIMQVGWQRINGNWYYLSTESDGQMRRGWYNIDGLWYYFNNDGVMQTGWIYDNGTWYYLYENGSMAASTWVGNYYVNASGAWVR